MPNVQIPPLERVALARPVAPIVDAYAETRNGVTTEALHGTGSIGGIPRGSKVGIVLGSRGLGAYRDLVRGVVDALVEHGCVPTLVPAMGSHGGGTPEGQRSVLADYGLADLGAAIDADDRTDVVGRTIDGCDVFVSTVARRMDALVVLNRVKAHTGFRGEIESGPSKMLALGLGKREGAASLHALGYANFSRRLAEARDLVLTVYPPTWAVAVVEGPTGDPASIDVMPAAHLSAREPVLLNAAKRWMPTLPFDKLDVLVIERAGKDVSGLGMDPNVTGRHAEGPATAPDPTRIVWLALTEASEGNANGMGFADVVTRRFADAVDPVATWTNAVTSTNVGAARHPIVAESEDDAVRIALATCRVPPGEARVARIRDTAHLAHIWVSAAAKAAMHR